MRSLVPLALALAACGPAVPAPYFIDDLRVVAVIADPPEVLPDEATTLTALVVDPEAPRATVSLKWTRCRGHSAGQNAVACAGREQILEAEAPSSVGTGVVLGAAQHTVSTDDVRGVPSIILDAGFWEHVRLRVTDSDREVDAIKRLVVSHAEASNTNPRLDTVDIHQLNIPITPSTTVGVGAVLDVAPHFDPRDLEPYRVLDLQGRWHDRVEEASFTWSVTSGQLDRWQTTAGDPDVRWTIGAEREVAHIFCVLRDGRGGTAAWFTEVRVR